MFPPALLAHAQDVLVERYDGYLDDRQHPDALMVGHKRQMITVTVEAGLDDQRLYRHPIVDALMRKLLGPRYLLGGFGAVVSLPGAPDQHVHQDRPSLYGSMVDDFMPSFAVTMIVPLVDLTERNGTTRMWPGSHLYSYWGGAPDGEYDRRPSADPLASVGDCLLMDYRLHHAGLANGSDRIRPVLYVTYARPWFRDDHNFKRQAPVRVSAATLELMSEGDRHLFSTAIVGP